MPVRLEPIEGENRADPDGSAAPEIDSDGGVRGFLDVDLPLGQVLPKLLTHAHGGTMIGGRVLSELCTPNQEAGLDGRTGKARAASMRRPRVGAWFVMPRFFTVEEANA